jgi:DNA-binding PadR family transcriptional regulator
MQKTERTTRKNLGPSQLSILRTLAETNREKLDLHTLFEVAGNDPNERARIIEEIEDLQSEGFIESRGSDFYTLTEKGRAAAAIRKEQQPDPETAQIGNWTRFGLPALVLLFAFLFLLFSGGIVRKHLYKGAPPAPGAPTNQPASTP